MEKIFTKIKTTTKQDLKLAIFGIVLISASAGYFVAYIVKVG